MPDSIYLKYVRKFIHQLIHQMISLREKELLLAILLLEDLQEDILTELVWVAVKYLLDSAESHGLDEQSELENLTNHDYL